MQRLFISAGVPGRLLTISGSMFVVVISDRVVNGRQTGTKTFTVSLETIQNINALSAGTSFA